MKTITLTEQQDVIRQFHQDQYYKIMSWLLENEWEGMRDDWDKETLADTVIRKLEELKSLKKPAVNNVCSHIAAG